MVNVVSRANQFILGQNVYTYMVNVVRRAIIKMFILRCECCEESNYQNVYTYMVNVTSRANQFILGQNVYTYMVNVVSRANQFILGQNVYTYMVNVVRRAIIKMFILIW